MATFKTSAIIELVDKSKKGATSALRNFGKLERAASGFGQQADKSASKAGLSFKQFEFEQKKAQDRLNGLRKDLRNGKGDFKAIGQEIDDTTDRLAKLNRENRDFRLGRSIGRGLRSAGAGIGRGFGAAARTLPIIGGALAGAGVGTLALAGNFAKQADEAGRLADAVGITVESLTALQFVSSQLAGEEGRAALPDALKELNKRIGELQRGEGTLTGLDKRFQSILASADGTEDAFVKLRKEIKASNLDSQQLGTLLDKTFGEAGFKLTRLFQASNTEFSRLTSQARELGIVLDRDAVNGGRKFLKEFGEIKTRLGAIGLSAGEALATPLAKIFDEVLEPRLKGFQDFISKLEPEDVERAFRNVAQFLESSAQSIADIAEVIGNFGGGLIETPREKRALDAVQANPELRKELYSRTGLFASQGTFQKESLNIIREEQEALNKQDEMIRILGQIVNKIGSGAGPEFSSISADAAIDTGLNRAPARRGIGSLLDIGDEPAFQ